MAPSFRGPRVCLRWGICLCFLAPPTLVARPAASAPPATQPTTRRISLNFKDAPLDVVLDHLSEAAGLLIVKEGPVEGRVTLQSAEPVSPQEAVALLSTVLKANGFTAIQTGRTVRLVPRDKAKKGAVPVHVGADPATIAATDELITQILPLLNVDAIKLRQELTPLLSTDADVTADESANAIIITDFSANIRRVAEVIQALDLGQNSSTELRLIHLKYASADETAKLLTSIFHGDGGAALNPQQMIQMQQQGMAVGPPPSGRSGRIPGGAIDQALHGGHFHADADKRTNTLILTAPVATLKVLEDIVKELDSNPIPASQIKAFRLNYAEADATAQLLENLLKPADTGNNSPFFFNPFASLSTESAKAKVNITHDARTNSVIVSAPADVLLSIEALIKDLDSSPGVGSEIRAFSLKHADAYDTASMIRSIFEPKEHSGDDNPFRFFLGLGPTPSKGSSVNVAADDRTNTLVVTAPREAMKMIGDLVERLDANSVSEDSLFIYRLRNAQSANLEVVLNTLFGNTNSQNQANPQQAGQNVQPGQTPGDQQNGGRARSSSAAASSGNLAGGTGIGARRGQRNGQGQGARNVPRSLSNFSAAISEMSGQVFVVADTDTNSLIVTTASKYQQAVRDIIRELDRPAPQVLIKVLVAEVTHDNSADWGLDFSVLNQRANGNGQVYGSNFGNAAAGAASGGLVVSLLEKNLNVTLHALAVAGKLDVLSRPYILASDNQLATITVGQEVPFITDTRITETGQTINTIQYQDVGIILNVTPHINPEGLVILDVSPEISELTGTTVPITAGVAAPVISKRSADSRVGIRSGETIVIGGLMEDRKTSTVSKTPIFGDIPLLGELLRRTQVSRTKTELLIFLTPHVALSPGALAPMSADEVRGTRLTPQAVEPGSFQQHMEGMHRGATGDRAPQDPSATQPVRTIRGAGATQP